MNIYLAQANVAHMLYPLDDPRMAEFVALLDHINMVAEQSPGFVWRLKDGEGPSSYLRIYDDPLILFNLTVWESIDALKAYAFRSEHGSVFRRRREWFADFGAPPFAMWWIRAGTLPSPAEGKARLAHLEEHGPTELAFAWRQPWPARLATPELLAEKVAC